MSVSKGMTAGNFIRERRHAAGLSGAQLAAATKLSSAMITYIETDQRPISDPVMAKLAKALKLTAAQRNELEILRIRDSIVALNKELAAASADLARRERRASRDA